MTTATYTGIVRGKSVVLQDTPTPLPDGTRVMVTPLPEVGTPAALLTAIHAGPHLTAVDIADLEAALETKKKPSTTTSMFLPETEGARD